MNSSTFPCRKINTLDYKALPRNAGAGEILQNQWNMHHVTFQKKKNSELQKGYGPRSF